MTEQIVSLIRSITGCSQRQAQTRVATFLEENAISIASRLSEDITTDHNLFGVFGSLEEALADRKERYNAPECYRYESPRGDRDWRMYLPLCIFRVSIERNGDVMAHNGYASVYDLTIIDERGYTIIGLELVAPMFGSDGNPEIVERYGEVIGGWISSKSLWLVDYAVEWYDEQHRYHVSPPNTPVPPDVRIFRFYSGLRRDEDALAHLSTVHSEFFDALYRAGGFRL